MDLLSTHLRRLRDFDGRENREPFWLWMLCLYVGQMIVGMVIAVPLQVWMQTAMLPRMEAAQKGGEMSPEQVFEPLLPFFSYMMIYVTILNLVYVALLAAALVRRLHDGGRSGYWGLPPFAIGLVGQAFVWWCVTQLPVFFRNPDVLRDFPVGWFMLFWVAGAVSSIVLLVFLVLPGTHGPNRYGDDPLEAYRASRKRAYEAADAPRPPAAVTRSGERRWDDPA